MPELQLHSPKEPINYLELVPQLEMHMAQLQAILQANHFEFLQAEKAALVAMATYAYTEDAARFLCIDLQTLKNRNTTLAKEYSNHYNADQKDDLPANSFSMAMWQLWLQSPELFANIDYINEFNNIVTESKQFIITPLQKVILILEASGYDLQQIAKYLNFNHQSVKNVLTDLYANMEINTYINQKSRSKHLVIAMLYRIYGDKLFVLSL